MNSILSTDQKIALVSYLLASCGKGPFEDCEPFQTEEVELNFRKYEEAAEEFIKAVREQLIQDIKTWARG